MDLSSAGKTSTLGLNQWVKTDGVEMADFNADNEKLDAAIAKLMGGAKMASGVITGDGSGDRTVELDFAPKLVIMYAKYDTYHMLTIMIGERSIKWENSSHYWDDNLLTDTGFQLKNAYNFSGVKTSYVAFG